MNKLNYWLSYIVITIIGGGLPLIIRLIYYIFYTENIEHFEITPIKDMAFFGMVLNLAVGYELIKHSKKVTSIIEHKTKLKITGTCLVAFALLSTIVINLTMQEFYHNLQFPHNKMNMFVNGLVLFSLPFSIFSVKWFIRDMKN